MSRPVLALVTALALGGATLAWGQSAVSPDPAAAPTGPYKLDPHHTSVVTRVVHWGVSNFAMRFDRITGSLDWDNADPTRSKLDVVIDPRSIDTGVPALDTEVANAMAANGPIIHFVSTRVEKTGFNTGRITGDLSFNGVTKPVVLETVFNGSRGGPGHRRMGFSAHTAFKRSDFAFTAFTQFASDDVKLEIESEFTQ